METQTTGQNLPRWVIPLVIGVVLLVGGALVFNALSPSRAEQNASTTPGSGGVPAYQPPTEGTPIDPPRAVKDFTLTNQAGEPMSLSDLRGKPVLIYFGYTFCPDICPTTLADMARVQQNLGDRGDDVAYVMVSVDGERDTPEVLNKYMANFGEGFIGLTGPDAEIRKITPDYGVYFQKNEVGGTSAAYLVDHSAAMYLLNAEGELAMIYGYGIPADVVTADVQAMLERQATR
ncbi:MAG: SCO family protein [Chloroflexaceae bacterium]|nr:SCO family protein [Chloroflexaceae bacterium]NJO05761.1 SCO family protein [Chloroflexaceae bacterium]